MKIVINARLLNERKGGPYRCLINTLEELSKIDHENTYHIMLKEEPEQEYEFMKKPNFIKKILPSKNKFIFDYILLPLYSLKNRRALYYFPKTTFAPYLRGAKINLYHDIIYFEDFSFREFKFFDNLHHKIMIPICAKLSDADISVSGFTADRMKNLLKTKPEKISVIHNGVEKSFKVIKNTKLLSEVVSKYNLKQPFLFFAGSLSPRKNILNIIRAFELIKDIIPHNIYFTAGQSWNDSEVFTYIKEQQLEGRIIKLGFLSEQDLVALYNLAECYLYPSFYEGFGLPILEAQACGCPVITSNTSSCPETAGNGALLVNPHEHRDIAEALLTVIKNKKIKQDLIKRGFENIKRFSWKKNAEQHLKLFKNVFAKRAFK
jgi:glycosyltransferase involved in cell wall biosynthesis